MQATSQPDGVPFGPYVYDAGNHKGIHYDGKILSFSMNGNPFDLIAINFDKVLYAFESHMFVTTNNGVEVEIPTTDTDYTFTFDPASFRSITSFTITPQHKLACVELDWIQFRTPETPDPVPEPSTFMLFGAGIGGFALWRRRAKH